jgi:acylpyruvate hydrolase
LKISSLYTSQKEPFLGARRATDGRFVHLNRALPSLPRELGALLRSPDYDLSRLQALVERADESLLVGPSELTFRPLVTDASKILCLGLNYVDHANESAHQKPEHPVVFGRYIQSFVGHAQPLLVPRESRHFDYEAELVVVIGKAGRRIPREAALSHVGGYSLMNDGSIRDYQKRNAQWTIGKNFDSSGSLGPDLVTPDELPAGARDLRLRGLLNGVVMQEASTSDMIFSVAEAIAILSEGMTLNVGDVIAMGTPGGVGFVRQPPVYMKAGDVFEVEVERVGTLRNAIAAE